MHSLTRLLATETSWSLPFAGETVIALRKYIDKFSDPSNSNAIYAHYFSFVNSSGTGKSRAVDELGKELLVIPLNLGSKDFSGLVFLHPVNIHRSNGPIQDFLLEIMSL